MRLDNPFKRCCAWKTSAAIGATWLIVLATDQQRNSTKEEIMRNNRPEVYRLPTNKEDFLRKAMALAYDVRVDELDCSKSMCRTQTDQTIEQVLQHCLADSKTHYTMILRDRRDYGGNLYFEVGASTMMNTPDYFLWIDLTVENGRKLIEDFNLERLQ
jgi:hypothetical protein